MLKIRLFSAAMLAVASLCGVAAVSLHTPAAYAESKGVSAKFGNPINEAKSLLAKGNARGALDKVQEAEAASNHSATENSILNQMKVAIYAKLGDGANMAKAAEAALASGQLTEQQRQTFRNAAAQGYLQAGNTEKFAEYAKGDPDMQALLAQAYLKQNKYALAQETIRGAINAAGGNAKEDWLLILSEAQRKSGDTKGSTETIQALLKSHPKPEYWKVVLAGFLNQKGLSDKARLDVYRLVYATDSFNGADEYTSMAETALIANSPGDAKKALEKGFSSKQLPPTADREKRLLANATARAQADQAKLPTIESQAAAQPNGDSLESVGEAYMSYGQYDKAVSMLQQAIAKGVTDPGAAKLHLGIAYAGAKQPEKARAAWNSVPGKDVNRQLAGLWAITLK
jgi:hypothetical protein